MGPESILLIFPSMPMAKCAFLTAEKLLLLWLGWEKGGNQIPLIRIRWISCLCSLIHIFTLLVQDSSDINALPVPQPSSVFLSKA